MIPSTPPDDVELKCEKLLEREPTAGVVRLIHRIGKVNFLEGLCSASSKRHIHTGSKRVGVDL